MASDIFKENNIKFKNDTINNEISSFLDNKNYFLCIDKNVYQKHYNYLKPLIENCLDIIIIEALEENKNQEHVDLIHKMLFDNMADRNSNLICIGGGLIGDLAGFAGATYMRGLNLIHVPTTLLACVDSCIGSKVAINKFQIKNLVGTFYPANYVLIDSTFLTTLSTRLFKEGLVELIKHGLLNDESILICLNQINSLEELRNDTELLIKLIKKSMKIKLDIVEKDYYDSKYRHQLNLGHSIAHCIELADNNDYLHGECVAIGILLALTLDNNYLNNNAYIYAKELFEKFECIKPFVDIDFSKLKYDKKKNKTVINEVILKDISNVSFKEFEINKLIDIYQKNYQTLKENIKVSPNQFIFYPTTLNGKLVLPPSKSYLHRYIIAASLTSTITVISNVTSLCDDVKVTIEAMKKYNVDFIYKDNKLIIDSRYFSMKNETFIDMKDSASSLRILLPLLINFTDNLNINGSKSLAKRPLTTYFNIFDENEIKYSLKSNDNLPLTINGLFKNNHFKIDELTSSQFISGLLFLLPMLDFNSTITLAQKPQSLNYIKMTIKVLNDFNIKIEHNENYDEFKILGNQKYLSKNNYNIENDYSALNFFEVANFLGNNIHLPSINNKTLQGDACLSALLNNNEPIDISNIPDSAPILALSMLENGGTLTNINRLKYKESNRIESIIDYLNKMGINYVLANDYLTIEKGEIIGGKFNTFNDHRIAITLIIASTKANSPVVLDEIKSINKSFPTFIEQYLNLGGFYDEK
ncbi:3-dehydroquinate synthetase/5-enolpyruvylshikimate-3-phosphate synthase [Bacilli bacterium PM5-3]|nr:3-dehydroquinate synthetase/5-enolpyruvylshikimate-3-phosphate synthase [Bacilli bacterium PM5-3]